MIRLVGILFMTLALVSGTASVHAAPPEQLRAEAEETARLLAKLLQAGRLVIEQNQTLIDDLHKGDKGFTPEVFERQMYEVFRQRTGIDLSAPAAKTALAVLPLARTLLPALSDAGKDVVRDAQVVINQRGIGYKNFIPVTFGSQAAARFSKRSHVQLKQTAIQPRNPKNEPDEYEASVLHWLSGRPNSDAYVSELTESGRTLRVMMPIYYQRECLACHGEPKGEWDISGYPKEGAREGDLAGVAAVWSGFADLGYDGVVYGVNRVARVVREGELFTRSEGLQPRDVAVLLARRDLVSSAAPAIFDEQVVRRGSVERKARIMGVTAEYARVRDRSLAAGRFIADADERSFARVAVIGHRLKARLFGSEDPLGKLVSVAGRPLRVIGVGKKLGNNFVNEDEFIEEMEGMYVPLGTLRKFYTGEDMPVSFIAVKTDRPGELGALTSEVAASLEIAHRGVRDFRVANIAEEIGARARPDPARSPTASLPL